MTIFILTHNLLDGKRHEGKDQGSCITVFAVPRTVPNMKWADKLFIELMSKQIFGPVC